MQKWEYCRINSGKTITEKVQLGTQYPDVIPGKMTVWVVVFYNSRNPTSPEILFSQEVEFDHSTREAIRSFRIALTEQAVAKLGAEGWEGYQVQMDEDAIPVFFLKRPVPG